MVLNPSICIDSNMHNIVNRLQVLGKLTMLFVIASVAVL